MVDTPDLSKKLSNLKSKETELLRLKTEQQKKLELARQKFFKRNETIKQFIQKFFRQPAFREFYSYVDETLPGVSVIEYSNSECLVFFLEAKNINADHFYLYSGYILDKDHREEIFDFENNSPLEIPVSDIDNSRFKQLKKYLEQVVARHINFMEDCLKKGYVRRILHEKIKNPWRL